jgi:hypothetical protein
VAKKKHKYAGTIPSGVRLVTLQELVPDRCNFKDKTFETYVKAFMESNMPGFPMGLLQTDGEGAYERWEIQPDDRYKVITVQATVYTCPGCSEEYQESAYKALENGICDSCRVEEETPVVSEPPTFETETKSYYVLVDTDYGDTSYVEDAGEETLDIGGETVEGWSCDNYDEDDAQSKADELNQEAASEGGYGFPWTHSWCYIPDERFDDNELRAAGFKVATYTGGDGSRNSDTFRLCGVDGSGFSFVGSIFASLVDIVCGGRNWSVKTDTGDAYLVDEDEKGLMEQLAGVHDAKT